jgi:hypothetical protein
MAQQLQLDVVTPERRVLSEAVDTTTIPGLNGELGILPGHTPLISQLKTGILTYTHDGRTSQLHVSGGFVEVRDDRVSVLEVKRNSNKRESIWSAPKFVCSWPLARPVNSKGILVPTVSLAAARYNLFHLTHSPF